MIGEHRKGFGICGPGNLLVFVDHHRETDGNTLKSIIGNIKAVCGANLRRRIFECYVDTMETYMYSVNQRCKVLESMQNDHVRHTQHARAQQEGGPYDRMEKHMLNL